MGDIPLVSVICTCYNQGKFVCEALDSVLEQNHSKIELFIIDNGSHDDSALKIKNWVQRHKGELKIIPFYYPETQNYCWAFNRGLFKSKGKFVVDLAADDLLLPGHVQKAVETLEISGAAAYFSNAWLLDENGKRRTFYKLNKSGGLHETVPQGDIYTILIRKYILCTATLVFEAGCLKEEGGYDEQLAYEDFDIIVRLSRKYRFVFSEHIGVTKRILKTSYSSRQYLARNSVMLPSTYRICKKIQAMSMAPEELRALKTRAMHEAKHALASANFKVAGKFLDLAKELGGNGLIIRFYRFWYNAKIDLSFFYGQWKNLRRG